MKKLVQTLCFIALISIQKNLDAQAVCDVPPNVSLCSPFCWQRAAFISIGAGYSWSTKADIDVDLAFWDPARQGYNDNVGSSEFYTVALGMHLNPIISGAFEAAWRPSFKYHKFQTTLLSSDPGFLGNKTRYLKLKSFDYLFNLYLNKAGNWWSLPLGDCMCLAPFVGGGVGVAYNTLFDFHSILPIPKGSTFKPARSIMTEKQKVSLAAQFMAGLVARINSRLSLDIAYRLFYGGRFKTNNYFVDVPSGNEASGIPFTTPIQASPWSGTLMTNEIYIGLNYNL